MKSVRSVFVGQHKAFDQLARPVIDADGEVLPQKQSLRARYRRNHYTPSPYWNYNLLRRMLAAGVGQNWDTFRAELQQKLGRDAKGCEALKWVEGQVAQRTHLVTGEVFVNDDFRGTVPVAEAWDAFFVHPVSRQLCRRPKAAPKLRKAAPATRIDLSEREQLHRVDGEWYLVELGLVSDIPESALGYAELTYDAVMRKHVRFAYCHWELSRIYGSSSVFGKSKRQLSRKELAQYGLLSPSEKLAA